MTALPSEDEVVGYFDSLSNWGRWGPEDQLGTLNLVTPEKRRAAAAGVRSGEVISLANNLDASDPDPLGRGSVMQRYMILFENESYGEGSRFAGCREFIGMVPHGSNTHLDALSHVMWDEHMYNGVPSSAVTSVDGATRLDVHQFRDGIVSRGVLLDLAGLKGVEALAPGEGVTPEDLLAAEERQGLRVEAGDVLLLHTGHLARVAAHGLHPEQHSPGLTAACLPFLRERDVALLGSDCINDVMPSGYGGPSLGLPVHAVALVALGLWLVDNVSLHDLALACRRDERYDFLFSMAPLRIVGSTSSPVNPLAIL